MEGLITHGIDLYRLLCVGRSEKNVLRGPDSVFLVHPRIMHAQMTPIRGRFVHLAIITHLYAQLTNLKKSTHTYSPLFTSAPESLAAKGPDVR